MFLGSLFQGKGDTSLETRKKDQKKKRRIGSPRGSNTTFVRRKEKGLRTSYKIERRNFRKLQKKSTKGCTSKGKREVRALGEELDAYFISSPVYENEQPISASQIQERVA